MSHDQIIVPSGSFEALGGSAAYVSLVASRLGLSVGILSTVGRDFKEDYSETLAEAGVDTAGVIRTPGRTTSFRNIYNEGRLRRQELLALSHSIRSTDLPAQYYGSAGIHFGPLLDEIDPRAIPMWSGGADFPSLDLQGLCRDSKVGRPVIPARSPRLNTCLKAVEMVKATSSEALIVTGEKDASRASARLHESGPEIVLTTLGRQGALLSYRGRIEEVPAFPPAELIDPTGAGDAFVGGFLYSYLQTGDVYRSVLIGSCVASFVVEDVGPRRIPSPEMLKKRLRDSGYDLRLDTRS
ncbi:MAG: carbohydrate kinase family protein [Candidatus Geothermarchaeales archaeon]